MITLKNGKPMPGNGSGVIIKSRGWIITNFHVLNQKGDEMVAMHEGRYIITDSIIAYDKLKDILILSLSPGNEQRVLKKIPDIKIRQRRKLKIGEKVYALGSPLGLENTITEGLLSGLRASGDSIQSLLQISAPISPGSSGGAVVDAKGRLIGISTLIMGGRNAQNLNFAVAADDVIAVAEGRSSPLGTSKATTASYQMNLASGYYTQKRYHKARELYHKARASANDNNTVGQIFHNIGLCWENEGRKDSAIFYFTRALEYQNNIHTHRSLAKILSSEGDFTGAIYHMKQALRFAPRDYDTHFMIAGAYMLNGDPQNAMPYLSKVLRMRPNYAPAWHLAGRTYAAAKEYDKAIAHFERAIQLSPGYEEAYREIIETYAAKGDFASAESWTEKLRQIAK